MDKRTIKIFDSYFGESEITKKDFISRWNSPALSIWTLFLDHGDAADAVFGERLVDKVKEKADEVFEELYSKENKQVTLQPWARNRLGFFYNNNN